MTAPCTEAYRNLTAHPQIFNLAKTLNLSRSKSGANTSAVGMMIGLWSWAAVNAPDGNLTHCPPEALAYASSWYGKPETLFNALVSCGWIDEIDGEYYLHDWDKYGAPFMSVEEPERPEDVECDVTIEKQAVKRKNDRERQRRRRAMSKTDKECDTSVTERDTSVTERDTSVTDSVTECDTSVTECDTSVTSSVTRDIANVERGSKINNNNLNITSIPRSTLALESSKDLQGAREEIQTAAELCDYFEENCHQIRSMPLLNAFAQSLRDGAELEMIRAVIDETALGNIDKPAAYVSKILGTLRSQHITTLSAFHARNERHRAKGGRKNEPTESDRYAPEELNTTRF